ncbi:MAG: tRNA (adenosine(37)-N6)-dimethylallyltransferase MiaA [bacterium]|nr:tRNA (adenosine(37)-N6)-dimethylallyltransferase MiaA [bacterium]
MRSAQSAKRLTKVIVVLGPTASGKSALAVELARRINGAVISADSRQVYKGLDIGTDKITKREMHGVPHFLLDVANPKRAYTAAGYARDAARAIRAVTAEGSVPIICGGTGFYINAVLYGLPFPEVPPNSAFRKKMERRSTETLFLKLKQLDPKRAETIDAKNRRRLIRALEIIAALRQAQGGGERSRTTATGVPIRPLKRTPRYAALKIGIALPRKMLRRRIAKRLTRDFRRGLIAEVQHLHRKGLSSRRLDELGLEYRSVARFLRSEIKTKKELEEMLEPAIMQYAKRQITWFKRDPEIRWIRSPHEAIRLAQQFLKR